MAEYAYPMDSNVTYNGNGVPSFDRAVTSAQLRGMISEIITNGVLMANDSNALRVIANGDNTVTVQPGLCVINGAIKKFTEPNTMLGDAIDFNNDRGIAICALLDPIERDIRIVFYRYNAQSATDLIPLNLLDRDDNRYAIQLANIYIAPGSTRIVQGNITDTRLNTERCGAVSSISQFDTTNLYNQIQSDLASFKSTEQAEFQEWFENLQTVLDSNAAAHLQNEIDGLSSSKANKSDITNISITGTTNNTGSTILAGTLFYLNGTLCKALTDIASGATLTLNTNYSEGNIGGCMPKIITDSTSILSSTTLTKSHTFNYPRGLKIITIEALNLLGSPQEMFLTKDNLSYEKYGNAQAISDFAGSLQVTTITYEESIDVWTKFNNSSNNQLTSRCVLL